MSMRERVAKAIYLTHQKEPALSWEAASKEVKDWVWQQARSPLLVMMQDFNGRMSEDW